MPMPLLIHITAGGLAIIAGYVALFAAKGAKLHRGTGVLFVYAMVTMALTGAGIAAVQRAEGSVIGGVLAAYMVITGLTTVRPRTPGSRLVDVGAMLVALAMGVACLALGLATLAGGESQRNGVPVAMTLLFGTVALLAGASDARVIRSGPLRGTPRVRRHLWRMCYALWIATGSFFLGQADEFPEPLRVFPLLAIPAFLPLLMMAYWLWRVRGGRSWSRTGPARRRLVTHVNPLARPLSAPEVSGG